MTRMTLNPQQAEFLETYVLNHRWTAAKKVGESNKFIRRKSKIYELMAQLPTIRLDDAKKAMALADQLANQGDFVAAYKAIEDTKFQLRELLANYDPQPDFDALGNDVGALTKLIARPVADYESFLKRPKDGSLSAKEWQDKIEAGLKRPLELLAKSQKVWGDLLQAERQLKEVEQMCRPDQLAPGAPIRKEIAKLKQSLQVLMKSPGKFMTADECRVKANGSAVAQAKAESDVNVLRDKIKLVINQLPTWVRQTVEKDIASLTSDLNAKEFSKALAFLKTVETKAAQLAKSFSPDKELNAVIAELGTVKKNIMTLTNEILQASKNFKPSGLPDVDELKRIAPQLVFTTKNYASTLVSLKDSTARSKELEALCKSGDEKVKCDKIKQAIAGLEKLLNPLRLPDGELKSLDQILRGIIAVRGSERVNKQAQSELKQDNAALANRDRIKDVLADSKTKMQQMKRVDRKQLQSQFQQKISAADTSGKTRDEKIKNIAKNVTIAINGMVKPEKVQSYESMDLMLLVATDELDAMLKKCLPSGDLQKDPNLLREISETVRRDWAASVTNRVTIDNQGKENARIGDDDYALDIELGRGGLGIAKLFRSKSNPNKKVVLKETQRPAIPNVPEDIQYIMLMESNREMAYELRAQSQVSTSKSDNVLKLNSLCVAPDGRVRAVMDFVDGGDMNKLKKQMQGLQDLNLLPQGAKSAVDRFLASQTLSGVAAMHGTGIVHHDLKGANVFLTKEMEVKVADFGSGIAMDEQGKVSNIDRPVAFTPGFDAPEGSSKEHDEAFDIFSVGQILNKELGVGKSPVKGVTSADRTLDALTKKESDARTTLEAAAETAYISQVGTFAETQEFKDLIKALMEPSSKAIGNFIKAHGKLLELLDLAKCVKLSMLCTVLTAMKEVSAAEDLTERIVKVGTASRAFAEDAFDAVKAIQLKQFKGGADQAREKAKTLTAALQKTEQAIRTQLPKLKKEVTELINEYNQTLKNADWGPVRTDISLEPRPSHIAEFLKDLPKAAMDAEAVSDSFDELPAAYQSLIKAINELPGEIEGGLQDIVNAGQKFVHSTG